MYVYVTSWLDIWSSQQRPQSLRGGYDLKIPGWESRLIDINQEGPGRISSNVIHCPLLMLEWNSFSILCAGFCQTNYCPVMGKFLVGVRPLAKRFQAGAPYRPCSICVWAKCSLTLWLQCNLENVPHLSRCSLKCQFSFWHTEHDMFKLTYLQNPPVPNSSTRWHSSIWHSSTRWLGECCREDGLSDASHAKIIADQSRCNLCRGLLPRHHPASSSYSQGETDTFFGGSCEVIVNRDKLPNPGIATIQAVQETRDPWQKVVVLEPSGKCSFQDVGRSWKIDFLSCLYRYYRYSILFDDIFNHFTNTLQYTCRSFGPALLDWCACQT